MLSFIFKSLYRTVLYQLFTKNTPNALLRIEKSFVPICNFQIQLIQYNQTSNMSQKSITSFFKFTPKKSPDVKKEIQEDVSMLNSSNETRDAEVATPKTKEKRSSKRARLDSSSSDSQPPKEASQNSPVDNKTKKQIKRQRIESSDSESESPNDSKNVKIDKVELKSSPKVYASPKTKKLSKEVEVKKEKSKSPSPIKQQLKTPVKSAEKKSKKSNGDGDKKKAISDKSKHLKSNGKSVKDSKVLKEKSENLNKQEPTKEETTEKVLESEYNPGKAKYHPIKDACWTAGQDVPYLALARTLEQIEATSGRLRMVEILSNYLRSVIALTPQDLLPSVYMCLNQLAPAYHSLELGIAETYLMKAIGQCTGRTLAQVKSAAQKTGDLGLVAEQARATQRTMFTPPPLKLRSVFAALKEIAHMTGQASVNKKIAKIQSLYVACRFSEARYLIRSLEGKLRVGLAEQSVLQAIAQSTAYTPPDPNGVKVLDASKGISADEFKARLDENALIIKTTYSECPNYDLVIPTLLEHGVKALPEHCRLTPGVPLKPMLAHPTRGVHEVFNRFEGELFTCEWKYDGERAQIHVPVSEDDKPDVAKASIFSRNQENNTSKYPDILGRLKSLLKDDVQSCVLDCEAVAYDTVNKQIQPFQILSTRKRKDAVDSEIKVQVCVFVFDLLYLNGRPLVREPLETRRELLRKHFNEVEGEWQFATSKDCSSMDEVQLFLDEAVRGSCEGLMVKTLHGERAHYDIARRSRNWLKLKKDYVEGVGDSLDIVVIGAYKGRGKRTGVFGGFLLACYDPDTEEYQSICKIGTGFSDEDLQTLTKTLEEHVIDSPRSYYRYDNSHVADVWVEPRCVWEVRCADLSLSPVHRAAIGLVQPDKGISLRFPRFIRVRDDKCPEQATSARQIAQLYLSQDQVKNQTGKLNDQDDFY